MTAIPAGSPSLNEAKAAFKVVWEGTTQRRSD